MQNATKVELAFSSEKLDFINEKHESLLISWHISISGSRCTHSDVKNFSTVGNWLWAYLCI